MADVPEPRCRKYWRQKLSSLKSKHNDITNKYPEAASVVQQAYKVLSDIESLGRYTPAKVGERCERTTTVNSAEETRANFCKILDGNLLFSSLYGMYIATLNELKVVLKVSAQAGQSGGANKTSAESAAQNDDFREVKTRNRRYSNENSQPRSRLLSVPKSAAVRLPTKAVITRSFFAPLRIKDMDTETTGAENTLPEQEAPRKLGRPAPVVMTSTTNLIRLQSDLKEHVKGEYLLTYRVEPFL
jgi:hypothetical protein